MTYTVTISQVGHQGVTGDRGLTWRGDWTLSTVYNVNDGVQNGGSTYICIADHTATADDEAGQGVNTATYWELMAASAEFTSALNQVSDVTITTPLDGQPLIYDAATSEWINSYSIADNLIINGLTVGRGASGSIGTTAFGVDTLTADTTLSTRTNTAIGYAAGYKITSGVNNVAIGGGALAGSLLDNNLSFDTFGAPQPVTGDSNTAVGGSALGRCLSGDRNTAVGSGAGSGVLAGSNSTLIGWGTGPNLTTTNPTDFTNNTLLGYQAGSSTSPFSIGSNGNRIVLGNNDITNAYIAVSWTVTSDERDKTDFAAMAHGLDVVDAIDTFTFKFDRRSAYYVYDEDGNIIDTPTPDGTHKSERMFVGFKAQQVQAVLDAAGFPSDVVVDTEDPENLKMKETALIPLLINAIKELKARVEVLEGGA